MRSTFLFGAVASAATAISASADLTGNPTPWEGGELEHRFVGSSSSFAPGDTLFDAQAGPYASLPAGAGLRGWTAYETTAASGGDSFFLGQFIFVGGVNTEGASVGFDFYEWDSAAGTPGGLRRQLQRGVAFGGRLHLDDHARSGLCDSHGRLRRDECR